MNLIWNWKSRGEDFDMQLVIGIVGEKGSGKQTFADFLKEIASDKRINHMRFSDLLRDTLTLWNLSHSRSNLQKVAIAFNSTFGEGTVSRALHKRVENDPADIVILDGVRWLSDEKLIREFPLNYLVYITADAKIRFERLKKRNDKIGEGEMDFAQFEREEKVQTETYIPQIGERSNLKIDNGGTFEDLNQKTRNWYLSLNL